MVAKDGFSKSARMEVHEDANDSTISAVSEANRDDQSVSDSEKSVTARNAPAASTIVVSKSSNEDYGNLSPIQASTPELPNSSATAQAGQAIVNKLDEIQNLCNDTMEEVTRLKEKWAEKEAEANRIQVNS